MLMVGGAGVAWAQREKTGGPLRDAVLDQVERDMKQAVGLLARSRSGESLRRLASSFRILAAHGAALQIDQRVKTALRTAVAREGRDALLWRPQDHQMLEAEARRLGLEGTQMLPLPIVPPLDPAQRRRALDELLANGVTRRWQELAAALDTASSVLDRRAAAERQGLAFVSQNAEQCQVVEDQMFYLNAEAVFWCGPWFTSWFPYGCGYTSAALLGVMFTYWYLGCV